MIELEPIGIVHNSRKIVEDDFWGGIVSTITIHEPLGAAALTGLESFSHAEVIFHLNQVEPNRVITGARHPRNNPDWPVVGILAQRAKLRPNRLGLTIVKILRCEGNVLFVEGLDAIDGTPVLDVKPVLREFLPAGEITQPAWATELMQDYWSTR